MFYSKFNLSNSLGHLHTAKYIKCLGEGGCGTVKLYRCKEHYNCDKLFVVKYIVYKKRYDKTYKDSRLFKKLTLNEYTIGTLLDHEYIIKTLDIDLYKNAIVFEHCNGIDFFDYIQKMSPFIQKKIYYFKQLIEGLIYMHNLGIAHMDLKLENIIIDTLNNKIKIIDFGNSKVFHDSLHKDTVILHRNIHGSMSYIAPEEFLEIEYNPEKVDVWSCGIILYIIIYNKFPWFKALTSDFNYKNYIKFINNNNNNKFFIEYDNILKKLLNPNPNTRPQIKEITSYFV
jgi:protein-serine/threonine kinase